MLRANCAVSIVSTDAVVAPRNLSLEDEPKRRGEKATVHSGGDLRRTSIMIHLCTKELV